MGCWTAKKLCGYVIMNTIAIILARQNSKGVPLKNLAQVGGVSLLGRAIEAAQLSQIFSHIVVSTDGDLIAQEAEKYSNVILVKRPDDLANDTATSILGVIHALNELNLNEGIVCLLQPTSPLRTAEHIQQAYQQFQLQNFQGSVISACVVEHHPYKCLVLDDVYQPVHLLEDLESPRQKLPKAFRPNGAIYFNDIQTIQQQQRFFNAPVALYEMNEQDSIDIDRPSDLVYANQLLEAINAKK